MADYANIFNAINLHNMRNSFIDSVSKESAFPHYNIKKSGEGKYTIELAVAGLTIADISIRLLGNVLTIESKSPKTDSADYIFKGIANRNFSRKFRLAEGVTVSSADLINGILSVYLDAVATEEKSIQINIAQPKSSETQLLNEDSVI